MVNQNPQPVVFSTDFELNAQETSAMIELQPEMGAPEQMKIYGLYVQVFPGYLDIGPSDDYPTRRRTWTDIDPLYIPVLNNPVRLRDETDTNPIYTTLPICCNPRPWDDLDLSIFVENNRIPNRAIDVSFINAKDDKYLLFTTPIHVLWSSRIYIRLQNNNTATPAYDTFSKVKITLVGEVLNEQELIRYEQLRG